MPIARPIWFLPLLTLFAACGGAPPQSAPPTGDVPPTPELAAALQELNAVRARARICGGKTPDEPPQHFPATTPLTWNDRLAAAAHAHALDMATRNYFAHDSPEGGRMQDRVEAAGYLPWRELGENLAAGYPAAEVMQGWLDSKSHCATLMNPLLREVGISVVESPRDNTYPNYWVQDFGAR